MKSRVVIAICVLAAGCSEGPAELASNSGVQNNLGTKREAVVANELKHPAPFKEKAPPASVNASDRISSEQLKLQKVPVPIGERSKIPPNLPPPPPPNNAYIARQRAFLDDVALNGLSVPDGGSYEQEYAAAKKRALGGVQ